MCDTAKQPNTGAIFLPLKWLLYFTSLFPEEKYKMLPAAGYKRMCHPVALGRNLGHSLLSHDQSVLVTLGLGHFPHG